MWARFEVDHDNAQTPNPTPASTRTSMGRSRSMSTSSSMSEHEHDCRLRASDTMGVKLRMGDSGSFGSCCHWRTRASLSQSRPFRDGFWCELNISHVVKEGQGCGRVHTTRHLACRSERQRVLHCCSLITEPVTGLPRMRVVLHSLEQFCFSRRGLHHQTMFWAYTSD